MKKVITAIGNPYLNKKLKEIEEYDVLVRDIQYQEGIFDILKLYKKIDLLIISTNILENDMKNFITNIKNISNMEIILFFNDEENIDIAFFNSIGIYKYFLNNEVGYNEFLYSITKNENILDKLKEDTKELKQDILKEKEKKKVKKANFENMEIKNIRNFNKKQIILISGERDVGKTMFLLLFLKYIQKQDIKTLVLDSCEKDCSIELILGNHIKNINYYKFINPYMEKRSLNIHKNIENFKKEYDCILIDNKFIKNDFSKKLLNICDSILFLIEPNLIGIKKAKNILEIYEEDYKISKNKIKIIFNKIDKNHICREILGEIFKGYEILEYINYSPEYSEYMSKNMNTNIKDNKFKNIYKKIFY